MNIDTNRLESIIEASCGASVKDALGVVEKAGAGKGLSLEDAACLLSVEDDGLLRLIHEKAGELKQRLFGKRVVLFAPLYLSNICANGCVYCGFRAANKEMARRALTVDEAVREAQAIESMGFKRILLVTGEDPERGVDYAVAVVKAIYARTDIRIIHVNAAPMTVDEFRELKGAGVGVYQSFQETYHRPTYALVHPSGRKRDYDWRLSVMDRACEAGFGDVGIGPLLGLYDYKFDCLAAIAHSLHLFERFGAHAHTISIPRLRPADGAAITDVAHPVTDGDLKKIVSVLRLAVPSAGVVVSTRESAPLRAGLVAIGATQLSAASRTNPGGYGNEATLEQFSTNDRRTLAEVMRSVAEEGLLPSLCTTCYRVGRVGHEFTEKTMAGGMSRLCQANAILTLKEYLEDYGSNGADAALRNALAASVEEIDDPATKRAVLEKLKEIEAGKRDLFF
ncbi:MAG: [FeFe] hydrogenase H-cluster radical SAM maturase HydG [Deltaproteobacteria bacterium RIFCSPLOWO2_02_FULL_53_8]|nr:MAG: [FeFe] hydrogenase H-cluster radical SAM maturase HydG [Deltaproteobacteria bacterium RIFCSPLOWO2_02_FULL_53_8]